MLAGNRVLDDVDEQFVMGQRRKDMAPLRGELRRDIVGRCAALPLHAQIGVPKGTSEVNEFDRFEELSTEMERFSAPDMGGKFLAAPVRLPVHRMAILAREAI
jgi:hypothetical protein